MRAIQKILIVALVVLLAGQIATTMYMRSLDNNDPPVITCPDDYILEVTAKDGTNADFLKDVKAHDNQDGDLTDRIVLGGMSKLTSHDMVKVTLLVFDSDNNVGKLVRKVRFTDYHRPMFDLREPMIFTSADEMALLKCVTVNDALEGDISNRISVSTTKQENEELYYVTVQVVNYLGDAASLRLPVLMQDYDTARPEIELKKYLIYTKVGAEFKAEDYLGTVMVDKVAVSNPDVKITGTVDTFNAGTYYIEYNYEANDRVGRAILTVVVQ